MFNIKRLKNNCAALIRTYCFLYVVKSGDSGVAQYLGFDFRIKRSRGGVYKCVPIALECNRTAQNHIFLSVFIPVFSLILSLYSLKLDLFTQLPNRKYLLTNIQSLLPVLVVKGIVY